MRGSPHVHSFQWINGAPKVDTVEGTSGEVKVLLKSIKCHTATGPDGISAWMLYTFADVIACLLKASLFLQVQRGVYLLPPRPTYP